MADEDDGINRDKDLPRSEEDAEDTGEVIGSAVMRPVFLGNLNNVYTPEQVTEIFEKPIQPKPDDPFGPIPVDRIDQKRGYCFIFLQDARDQADKERCERFVSAINGMQVPGVSKALRAEFARGDGRIKRKEDERRRNIEPSETLFVVNFHEETTRREDLEMLFSPFGELVRIDMKRNYAFVQFKTIEQATKAKETTNGGKLDQSVLTVEYVARQQQRNSSGSRDRGRRDRGRRGRDDRRDRSGGRDDSYDRRSHERRYEEEGRSNRRRDSPPPYRRPRSTSRSRSPPPRYGHRSRSPPRGRNDDRHDGYKDYRRGPSPMGYRGRSPLPGRDLHRGDRDRDRGYRG